MAGVIVNLLGGKHGADGATLHVEFKVKEDDELRTFKASGPARDVLKAMKRFDETHG